MDNAIINGNATNYFSKSLVTTTQDMIKQLAIEAIKPNINVSKEFWVGSFHIKVNIH